MKVLPLHQPWAQLVANGKKQWETRGRRILYRGPVAIHACRKSMGDFLRTNPIIEAAFKEEQIFRLGCIVAIAELTECISTTEWMRRYCTSKFPHPDFIRSKAEYDFGNYDPGRFAWHLENVRKLAKPYPYKGHQGIRNLEPEHEAEVMKRLI